MASGQISTGNEGENQRQFNFNQWINDNNLNEIKGLLIKHNMNTLDTLNIGSNQFDALISDPQLLSKPQFIPLIVSSLKKISKDAVNDNNMNKSKIVVISEQEEECVNKLNKYNVNISRLIQTLSDKDDELNSNIKQCEIKIDSSFNYLQQLIDKKKNEIKEKLKVIENKKKSEINAKSQTINAEQMKTKNGIKSCNALIEDHNIDRTQRKQQIVSLSDEILNKPLSDRVVNIDTNIHFVFNKEGISSFISCLCDIYSTKPYPLPIINGVEVKNITTTTADICFNAKVNKKDFNDEIKSKLFLKIESVNDDEMDEKEQEMINSPFIAYNMDQTNYKYELKQLSKNKDYAININVYECMENDKENMQRNDFKPISVGFKTKSYGIDKSFVYSSDFDVNGIIYGIGSDFGKKGWENPVDSGLIAVTSSGWNDGSVSSVVAREAISGNHTNSQENGWINIDLKAKLKVKPTAYTIRHDTNTSHYLRNWVFEGSEDGNNWEIIKQHTNDASINAAKQSKTWRINDCNKYYRMFRIHITGANSSDNYHILCHGFELYGHLLGQK